MSKSNLKRSSSCPDVSESNKRRRTSVYQLPGSTLELSVKSIYCSQADLYDSDDTEIHELAITDYNCKFLKDFIDIAKKGDVADSIHHDFEYGITDISINNKLYRIKKGYFFYGNVQVFSLGSDKWDGSMATIDKDLQFQEWDGSMTNIE